MLSESHDLCDNVCDNQQYVPTLELRANKRKRGVNKTFDYDFKHQKYRLHRLNEARGDIRREEHAEWVRLSEWIVNLVDEQLRARCQVEFREDECRESVEDACWRACGKFEKVVAQSL